MTDAQVDVLFLDIPFVRELCRPLVRKRSLPASLLATTVPLHPPGLRDPIIAPATTRSRGDRAEGHEEYR